MKEPSRVYFAEARGRGVFLRAAPIDVAEELQARLYRRTDTVDLHERHARRAGPLRLLPPPGRPRARVRRRRGALPRAVRLRAPGGDRLARRGCPSRTHPASSRRPPAAIRELTAVTGGRAFVLCTSNRNMIALHARARTTCPTSCCSRASGPRRGSSSSFRAEPSVLFATASFWEGVDVPGDALSLVVIDRLPFAPPGDPVVAARLRALEARGARRVLRAAGPGRRARAAPGLRAARPHARGPRARRDPGPAARHEGLRPRVPRHVAALPAAADRGRGARLVGARLAARPGVTPAHRCTSREHRLTVRAAVRSRPGRPAIRAAVMGYSRPLATGTRRGPPKHGPVQRRHPRDRRQGRLLRPGAVREDDEPPGALPEDRSEGPRASHDARHEGRPDAVLRHDARVLPHAGGREGEAEALHGAGPGDARVHPPHRAPGHGRGGVRRRLAPQRGRADARLLEQHAEEPGGERARLPDPAHRHPDEQARPRGRARRRRARRSPARDPAAHRAGGGDPRRGRPRDAARAAPAPYRSLDRALRPRVEVAGLGARVPRPDLRARGRARARSSPEAPAR